MNADTKQKLAAAYAESHHAHDLAKVMSAAPALQVEHANQLLNHAQRLVCVARGLQNIAIGTPEPKRAP